MSGIPSQPARFVQVVYEQFPEGDLSGLTVRTIQKPDHPEMTVVYIGDLMEPADLERLLLTPLAGGVKVPSLIGLAREGRLPAPVIRHVADADGLQAGLLAGLAALHMEGCPDVLLVGSGIQAAPQDAFGPDATANIAVIRRTVRSSSLRVERLSRASGGHCGMAYLAGSADPAVVNRARAWALALTPQPDRAPWWRVLVRLVRLPPVLECPSPAAVADWLRRGYVAVLTDHLPGAQVGPLTLELLLSGCQDVTLPSVVRRGTVWLRIVACLIALLSAASLVAVTAYHHSLLPAPFLVALASGRQNFPFPIVVEVMLVLLLSEGMLAGTLVLGGRRWILLSALATVVASMTALHAGVIAPIPVVAGIAAVVALLVLPNQTITRAVQLWRYLFIGAAAGLGIFGLSLLLFVMLVYLGEERRFGHPLRCAVRAVSR